MRSWLLMLVKWGRKLHFKYFSVFFLFFLVMNFIFLFLKSENETSSESNLDVCLHGLLYEARLNKKDKLNYLDSAIIEISDAASLKIRNKFFTNKAGAFFAKIPLQQKLSVKFIKHGWFSRQLIIDTHVPVEHVKQYHLFIDAELFEKINGLPIDEKDFPVLEIYYDKEERRFVTYLYRSNSFNKKIRKLYSNNK
jgi:hypothetical protein